MTDIARHVRVYGQVQGVFFRAWLRELADKLEVAGWVRNFPDGRVEAHVEGKQSAVEKIIQRIRTGPSGAIVEDVRLWDVDSCDFDGFEIRP